MAILKTRYEKGQDATFRANAAIQGGRLVTPNAVGDTPTKPKVVHTTGPGDYAVGAALNDVALGEDVTVTHRGWQLLEASEAITFNTDIFASTNGRIQQGNGGVTTAKPYGRAFNAAGAAGAFVWVKVYL